MATCTIEPARRGTKRDPSSHPKPEAGPRLALEQAVLDDQTLTPMAIVVPGDQEILDFVANDRTAIGLVPASWLDGESRRSG